MKSRVAVLITAVLCVPSLAGAQTASADADIYEVTIAIERTKSNGSAWDGDGSGPEIRLHVETPGGSSRVPDGCNNTWSCRFPRVYFPRGAIARVMDEDFANNDLVGRGPCDASPDGIVECRLGSAVVSFLPLARAQARAAEEALTRAMPRNISVGELRRLLLGQSVAGWRFEASEPFDATIQDQQFSADRSVVTALVRTNSSDGRQPASGVLRVSVLWRNSAPTLLSVESVDFGLNAARGAAPTTVHSPETPGVIAAGFVPDPHVLEGVSAGSIDASHWAPGCVGFVSSEPNHIVTLQTHFAHLRILAHSARTDLTLVVQAPDGRFLCQDDVEGSDPIIEGRMGQGVYRIWVGTYSPNVATTYQLGLSELTSVTAASLQAVSFDAALVARQIRTRLPAIRRCYEVELSRQPTLSGQGTVEFTIEPSGRSSGAAATSNSTGSLAVENCVVATVARLRFNPPPPAPVRFSYPFAFVPSN